MAEKAAIQTAEPLMRKEIYEIPNAVKNTLSDFNADGALRRRIKELFSDRKRLVFVGCGTAHHACLLGKQLFNSLLKLPVETEFSSEFACAALPPDKKSLIVAVSQSGETADTLAAVRFAKENGAAVLAICNVKDSSLTKEADTVIYTNAGSENAIAATKSYITQIFVFYLIALLLCKNNKKAAAITTGIEAIPSLIKEALKCEQQIKILAEKHRAKKCVLFAGRNADFVTAKEASLKLKEITYTFSDGLAAGELRHGTMALVDADTLTVAISTQQAVHDKNERLLAEVKTRGGDTMLLTQFESGCDCVIKLPSASELLMPIVSVIPLQLFALWISVYKNLNPDAPRNLTKSVTAE